MSRNFQPQRRDLKELYEVMAGLETPQDVRDFLIDLCTPNELMALAGRWQVAQLVKRGLSYREISDATGASTATITRVGRSMQFGKGYQRVLENQEKMENE